ncbi:MAG: response regulator [Oscillospiraceae bacterium]|nr:response regulator [Oscillospiraceae bacterium]MBQ9721839.1 response regulator [Oscillospiraceae bacterium]
MNGATPRGPRMYAINIVSAALAILVAVLFFLSSRQIDRAYEEANRATEKYVASEMAATTLKQSSDNLTTQVRLYTITQNPEYLRAYFAEVATSNRERAVETLDYYLTGTEAYSYLENALESSIELMEREYYAMALVLDATGGQLEPGMEALEAVKLTAEDQRLGAPEKLALAVALTHDEGYQQYDGVIDEDVAKCVELLRIEQESAQDASFTTLARMRTNQYLCALLLVLAILLHGILTNAYIVRPINGSVKLLSDDQPLLLRGAYELQYLESAYNAMYEQRKEREQLVAERMQALELVERERTSLNIVHEMLQSGMWSMDFNEAGEMCSVTWSDQFRKMLGYESEEDFPNTLEAWSDLLHEEDSERVLKAYYDTLRDYTGQSTYDVEYRLMTKDRGWRWFHEVGRPSRREDGSPITYVGLFVDITEQKEMERQLEEKQRRLEEALEQAQAANRAKTAFLTNMSHDMRTPMNAIIGFTTLANAQLGNEEAIRDYLGKISASGTHLLALIDDVLDMSRIESGPVALRERECSLTAILRDVEAITQADVNAKKLRLRMELAELQNDRVVCDNTRVSQILLNIVSNSIKFTPDGGTINIRVGQRAGARDGSAIYEFRISDTGIGMSREFQERIFEPFERERTSTVSGLEGTGLGLAITKNLVDLMNGEISVESEEGRGTEVKVSLPLRLSADVPQTGREPASAADSGMPADAVSGNAFQGKSVLLVEDNEINQEISQMILESSGFTVDIAEDGSVAVEKVRAAEPGRYDLILMDIQMPVMNGYEATRQIRALDSPLSGIPIIALSANAFEEDKRNSLDAGMNDHVGKPIDVEHLLGVLKKYLFR